MSNDELIAIEQADAERKMRAGHWQWLADNEDKPMTDTVGTKGNPCPTCGWPFAQRDALDVKLDKVIAEPVAPPAGEKCPHCGIKYGYHSTECPLVCGDCGNVHPDGECPVAPPAKKEDSPHRHRFAPDSYYEPVAPPAGDHCPFCGYDAPSPSPAIGDVEKLIERLERDPQAVGVNIVRQAAAMLRSLAAEKAKVEDKLEAVTIERDKAKHGG